MPHLAAEGVQISKGQDRAAPATRCSPLEGGVRFACQGSGHCCTSRGPYAYVYLTPEDRRRLAAHLGLDTPAFTRRYCARTDDELHLGHPELDCCFLAEGRCTVYEARPQQCRTWPFWPENMDVSAWREVAAECRGIGRGRRYTPDEIRGILAEQEEVDHPRASGRGSQPAKKGRGRC